MSAKAAQKEKEDYEFWVMLTSPKPVRQLSIDIESYDKKLKEREQEHALHPNLVEKAELALLWMEIVNRKDLYRQYTSLLFELPYELKPNDKKYLQNFFIHLNGFCWKQTFGWIGQTQAANRLAIEPFQSSASLCDGLIIQNINKQSKQTGIITPVVTQLTLAGYGCQGIIMSNDLSFLQHCQFLNLNYNLICGMLPSKGLIHLTQLQTLELASNELQGTLDTYSFQSMKNLIKLDLSFNELTGNLPEDWFSCFPLLESLNLSGNRLTGSLPISIKELTKIKEIKLYGNIFSGIITLDMFTSLRELTILNLSQNKFEGTIDAFVTNIKLVCLQLNHNQFHGSIPSLLGNLIKLEILYLQNNQFSGHIPEDICQLHRLRLCNLSYNQLIGVLPESMDQFQQLESLLLHENNIVGPIPQTFGSLHQLHDMNIFKQFPSEFTQLPRAFNRYYFERIYQFGPSVGINSVCWTNEELYGIENTVYDHQYFDDSRSEVATIFSGQL